jgi:hypothetical protein
MNSNNLDESNTVIEEFPKTAIKSADVDRKFKVYLKLASLMLSTWLRRPYQAALDNSKLDVRVRNLSILLDVQACRQFRSIIALCQIGESQNADIIARSLFETVIATNFIFEPIAIVVEPISRQPAKRLPSTNRWRARVARNDDQPSALSQSTRAMSTCFFASTRSWV